MPLLSVQIVADYVELGVWPVRDFYELPQWLMDEIREVLSIYRANRPKES
jgi:hypothetical protein